MITHTGGFCHCYYFTLQLIDSRLYSTITRLGTIILPRFGRILDLTLNAFSVTGENPALDFFSISLELLILGCYTDHFNFA